MARKSRKNMPVAVAEPTDNLTAKAVLSMDKEAKTYQVGIYARLSFESEANKERDTVDTQIAYIREFINSQDDMVDVEVYESPDNLYDPGKTSISFNADRIKSHVEQST